MRKKSTYVIYLGLLTALCVGVILFIGAEEKPLETNVNDVKKDDREYIRKQAILQLDLPEEEIVDDGVLIPSQDRGCTPEMFNDGLVSVDCKEAIDVFQCGNPVTLEEYVQEWLTTDGELDYAKAEEKGVNLHRIAYPTFPSNLEPLVLIHFCQDTKQTVVTNQQQVNEKPKWDKTLKQEAEKVQYRLVDLYRKTAQLQDDETISMILADYLDVVTDEDVQYFSRLGQEVTGVLITTKDMQYVSHTSTTVSYSVEVQVDYTYNGVRKKENVTSTIGFNQANGKVTSHYRWIQEVGN